VVEDDVLSAKSLLALLKSEKYTPDLASGYKEACELLDKNTYAIILLDWNLGDGDGLDIIKELRDIQVSTPVLMLSANSDVDGRVTVLDSGADDYLCKPYSHLELLARMRALLRRDSKEKKTSIIIGKVKIDLISREVFVDEKPVSLTGSEFDLLELFMKNPNNVLTRFQLSEHINKDNYAVKHSNLIDVHIKNIRKKIGSKDFIKNIRSVGYKINSSS